MTMGDNAKQGCFCLFPLPLKSFARCTALTKRKTNQKDNDKLCVGTFETQAMLRRSDSAELAKYLTTDINGDLLQNRIALKFNQFALPDDESSQWCRDSAVYVRDTSSSTWDSGYFDGCDYDDDECLKPPNHPFSTSIRDEEEKEGALRKKEQAQVGLQSVRSRPRWLAM
jgi:hypothetical protein